MAIALREGYAAFIHPRSGLAAKHGITVVNAPGTIDAGYRGEISVCLLNTDKEKAVEFKRGDRIAQFVIQRIDIAAFVRVEALSESVRGTAGSGPPEGSTSRSRASAGELPAERFPGLQLGLQRFHG